MTKFNLTILLSLFLLTSCHMKMESQFYKDKTASMSMFVEYDESLMDFLNSSMTEDSASKEEINKAKELPSDWISVYDLALLHNENIPTDPDSIRFMKLMEIKFDVGNQDKLKGFGMKISRASEEDLSHFRDLSMIMNPIAQLDKQKTEETIKGTQTQWDGQKLIIHLENPNSEKEEKTGKKKKVANVEEDQSLDMAKDMLNDVNFTITYIYTFENKIKKIKGKHDFVRKKDDYTIEYVIDMKKTIEMEEKGKKLRHKDKVITVFTY